MLSKFSVRKPYTVLVSVILVIILGVVSFMNMTVDLLPSMNLPYVIVMTTYPGASPETVETVVTKPVEQSMATISNISNITSTSQENASTVILEFEQSANMDSVTIEMRETLDQISGYWPDEVSNPMIMKMNPDMMPVMVASIGADVEDVGEASERIENDIIPEIESIEGVASVDVSGTVERAIEVKIDEGKIAVLNKKIQNAINGEFDDAKSELDSAASEISSGEKKLQSGEKELTSQSAQISEAQLELENQEKQLEQEYNKAIESAYNAIEDAEEMKDLRALIEFQKINATSTPEEIKALNEQYDTLLSQGKTQAKTAIDEQFDPIKQQLAEAKLQLAQGKSALDAASISASIELASAKAGLQSAKSQIEDGKKQLEEAQESAIDASNLEQTITVDMVSQILYAQNFSMPAGYVTEEGIDYLIRVGNQFQSIEDIMEVSLFDLGIEGIDVIKLADVAEVYYTSNQAEVYAKINGKPGVMISIQKQTGYATGDVSGRIEERFQSIEENNEGISIVTLMDQGIYIEMIINSVLQNMIFGGILAILILLFFLRSIRPTFVIACSIPISVITAIVLMYFSGVTLNIISLSGLALGIGMLVDNSIVVIENIYRMRNEEGMSARAAAIEGAKQVSGAICASTLTTVCVFAPIVFTQGVTKQLFLDMGLTIGYSLLASLVIALTLVPMLSAALLKKEKKPETRIYKRIQNTYGFLLRGALKVKPLVLIGALGLLVLSAALAYQRGIAFMPDMESTQVSMVLTTDQTSTLEETGEEADKLMDILLSMEDIENVGAMVASSGYMGQSNKTNEVSIYMILKEDKKLSNVEIEKEIYAKTESINGELTVSMSSMDMSALGSSGIVIAVKGNNLDRLQEISADLSDIVESVEGTENVSDGMEESTEELRVIVDKEKAAQKNLTVAQVFQYINGEIKEASSMTALSTDVAEYEIKVIDGTTSEYTRNDIRELSFVVTGQDGSTETIYLKDIASFEEAVGPQSIQHDGQTRTMNVTAEIAEGYNIGLVGNDVKAAIAEYETPTGYSIEMAGEDESIMESMVELFKMLALAIVFMYLIMVAQFQSLKSPFIIMFTVPLAFTGGLLGLYLTGSEVSVIAMIGFVMLAGIIVNNGIVFVDYTNQLMRQGKEKKEALIEAGKTRLRPIIMTALTTILGLSTMAIGMGMGADMVQPMAIVTIGGLIYGTLLTLFVVPCVFDIIHRKKVKKRKVEEGEG